MRQNHTSDADFPFVQCDLCAKDYTLDETSAGGMIVLSNAICPACSDRFLQLTLSYGEQHCIRARCPDNMTFRDFMRRYRANSLPAEFLGPGPYADVKPAAQQDN